MEATLQKVQQELKSDEWELRVDGLKALTKLGEETKTPDDRQKLAKLLKQEGIGKLVTDQLRNLRSVVAAAACRCATALATGLGSVRDGRSWTDNHLGFGRMWRSARPTPISRDKLAEWQQLWNERHVRDRT